MLGISGLILLVSLLIAFLGTLDSSESPSTNDALQQSLDSYGFGLTNQSLETLSHLPAFGVFLKIISALHRFDVFLSDQIPSTRLPRSNADIKNEEAEYRTLPPLMNAEREVSGERVRVPSLKEAVHQAWTSADWRRWRRVGYAECATLVVWVSWAVGPMLAWKATGWLIQGPVIRSLLLTNGKIDVDSVYFSQAMIAPTDLLLPLSQIDQIGQLLAAILIPFAVFLSVSFLAVLRGEFGIFWSYEEKIQVGTMYGHQQEPFQLEISQLVLR